MNIKTISPQQRLTLLPFEPENIYSNLRTPHVRLEDYRFLPPSDINMPPMNYHIIAFHYKPPVGLLRHRCGGKWVEGTMLQNDITFVPAFRDNQWQFDGEFPNCFHILLDDSFLTQTALSSFDIEINYENFIDSFQVQDVQLQKFAELLHLELINNGKHGPIFTEGLTNALAIYLISQFSNRQPKNHTSSGSLTNRQFNQTVDLMQDQLGEKLSIQKMAQNLHLSPYHFSRLFRHCTGISPYQYLMSLRLEKAKSLLVTKPEKSLASIAQIVGFADQSHFASQFKKRFDVTPRDYKNLYS